MNDINRKYQNEFEALNRLFGVDEVQSKINRLNEIHDFTENIWNDYVSGIPEKKIKYLLIAEAPPWSESGRPQYFLDHNSRSRSILNAVKKAVFPSSVSSKISAQEVLHELSQMGFLIIDSIPFSMNYSQSNKRSTVAYNELVRHSMKGYFKEKINHPSLVWTSNLRIAFTLKRNANTIIDVMDGQITLGKRDYPLSENLIAVNGAGYPDSNALRRIFNV